MNSALFRQKQKEEKSLVVPANTAKIPANTAKKFTNNTALRFHFVLTP